MLSTLPLHRRRLLIATSAKLSLLGLAGSGMAALTAGCAGAPDSATKQPPRQQIYTEKVSSLLLSRDNKNFVFIGRDHHYILDAPPQLVASLASPLHPKIKGFISSLHVDEQAQVTGRYRLTLEGELTMAERDAATALGFVPDTEHVQSLVLAGDIVGKRYMRGTLREGRQLEPLNQVYSVEITADQSRADAAAEKMLTPLTVGTDGVLLLYYIVLAPVLVPLAIVTREPRR
ncbi:hypothetical protein [Roseateles koreensis]|uniref:5-formyltetrahydrofolate cyclo-ligase n=1 Tax=Roseateles koreensis TaxID=2987526 RepID=A0ABT5KLX6_9BURK|nr:hypothetical protein [Roseateles koreensis]MDC8783918.1 hypothetical protein [Roseateles koreensis]